MRFENPQGPTPPTWALSNPDARQDLVFILLRQYMVVIETSQRQPATEALPYVDGNRYVLVVQKPNCYWHIANPATVATVHVIRLRLGSRLERLGLQRSHRRLPRQKQYSTRRRTQHMECPRFKNNYGSFSGVAGSRYTVHVLQLHNCHWDVPNRVTINDDPSRRLIQGNTPFNDMVMMGTYCTKTQQSSQLVVALPTRGDELKDD
jgi:hypothetical protein